MAAAAIARMLVSNHRSPACLACCIARVNAANAATFRQRHEVDVAGRVLQGSQGSCVAVPLDGWPRLLDQGAQFRRASVPDRTYASQIIPASRALSSPTRSPAAAH